MILALRRVLESAGQGSGLSRSIVEGMRHSGGEGREAASLILLGNPISAALRPLLAYPSEEVALLASLVLAGTKSSAPLVGRTGSAMALTLERWAKAKENRALELKVMRFRSLVTSGVLGAVAAMISTLGPLVGNLSFMAGPGTGPGALVFGAAAMTAISSGVLGAFMSGKGFYVNVILSTGVFVAVSAAASPLANLPSVGLLGVK